MKIDNEKLPVPRQDELHYTKKADYFRRMYNEKNPDNYGITNIQFANWVLITFNEYYQNNKHITYREAQKISLR
jgi:hypothetical protein